VTTPTGKDPEPEAAGGGRPERGHAEHGRPAAGGEGCEGTRPMPSKTTHPLRLFSGSSNRPLAERVARELETHLGGCTTTRLPDTETHVMLDDSVRGDDVVIIQPCSAPVNEHLVELLFYVDAFRRASVHSITAVVPYFPYARQERMARGRESISAKVVATMLEALGTSRVVFVDVHAAAIQGFFNIPVDPLSAVSVLCQGVREKVPLGDAVVVAPDAGRVKLAGQYANALGIPLVLMHKRRTSFSRAITTHVVGDIRDRVPIVIDDIIAGGSVLEQLEALTEAGARPEIYLAITHGVLTPTALQRLERPEIRELLITDSIALTPERAHPKIRVCSIAKLLARVIQRIHEGSSLGDLMERF